MIGFINFRSEKYGFIVYPSKSNSALDSDIFFIPSSCGGWTFERGQAVEFEISEEGGRTAAVDIRSVEEVRIRGAIVSIRGKSGFIEADDRFGDDPRIHFFVSDFVPDIVGRSCAAGMAVSFVTTIRAGREFAVRVRHEDPSLLDLDPSTYWEIGEVVKLDGLRAHIKRPNHSGYIPFFTDRVECPDSIQIGVRVAYRIVVDLNLFDRKSRRFWNRIFAADVQIHPEETEYEPEPGSIEARMLAAPELPLAPVEPESIFAPQNRTKTLRQLIEERKFVA